MDLISTALTWAYKLIAAWYGIIIVGGVLVFAFEACARKREPSEHEVRSAAERYREYYGKEAMAKLGDHMLAATFVQDGRHRRFLKRVSAFLQD